MSPTVTAACPVPTSAHHPVPRAARVSIALSASVLVGVLATYGQTVPGLAAVTDASGPWFVVVVAVCVLTGVRPGPRGTALAALLGATSSGLLHAGWWAASNLRDPLGPSTPAGAWLPVALAVGALAGVVAVALRSRDGRRRAAAVGGTAAVLVGEGTGALLQLTGDAATTGWVAQVVLGTGVLVVGALSARTPVARVVALGTGVVGAVVVLGLRLVVGS